MSTEGGEAMAPGEIEKRLADLRRQMDRNGLSFYIVDGTDAHFSEYVAPHWRTREFISGFTGSAGVVLVTSTQAFLWTDSRYFIQAEKELEGSGISLMKMDTPGYPSLEEYLAENAEPSQKVGQCASTLSISRFNQLSALLASSCASFVATGDLAGSIWTDRPDYPFSSVHALPLSIAGLTSADKLEKIRSHLASCGADYTFIASLDDIAWITNLRGADIECNPVFLSFLFIDSGKAVLFTDRKRFDSETLETVSQDFIVQDYNDVFFVLGQLVHGKSYYNDERVNTLFKEILDREGSITGRDFSTDMKACKNVLELAGMRSSHLLDAVAFVNAMSRIDFSCVDGRYKEMDISALLEEERAKMPGYRGPSFAPISAFGEHGAIVHYSANDSSNAAIDKSGLLVLDTGAQYDCGTTDITRTLLFGQASAEQKRDYTLVLKGHLALARQRFIQGTRGYQLDVLAKQFLWMYGLSFFHGTGHGVGCCLNVHEGPARISPAMIDVPLEEGMVLSDEPGVYKEGQYGIRIENLLAVQKDIKTQMGQFLSFETLTLVPYERRLIDLSLLSQEEVNLVNSYHEWIYDELHDRVSTGALEYLRQSTLPLGE